MSSANAVRLQLESALAHRIPSAFTPAQQVVPTLSSVGIAGVDQLLQGGFPVGAITEIVGTESSGRTSLALSFLAGLTQAGKVCAWVDASNALHPESAVSAGVDLSRMLWVRCGSSSRGQSASTQAGGFALPKAYLAPPPIKKGLHGGGYGPHPRTEGKGLAEAIGGFLTPDAMAHWPRGQEQSPKQMTEPFLPGSAKGTGRQRVPGTPWLRMEQALRVTDLLLQAGGFSAIVLDIGGIAPEFAARVPLATWFRYRKAAERTQGSILLLTQHACAKSSAGLVLRLQAANVFHEETVFSGLEYHVEIVRESLKARQSNVIPLRRPPQRETRACWKSSMTWVGSR